VSKQNNKKQNTFQVYGYNNCLSLLKEADYKIISIQILDEKKSVFSQKIDFQKHSKLIHFLSKKDFYKKFDNIRSQGIVIFFEGPIIRKFDNYKLENQNSCLLILDQIEDPQNAGQIIRTSECAGIDGIIFPSHNSFKLTNTIINISQGAFVNMNLYEVTNISTTILELKKNDYWIIGIENSIDSKLWNELDYSGNIAIVIGSEGKGIRKKVIDHCDFLGNIPMQGNTNSLNVSAAVSAVLFERLRQIKFK
jgi:23S rRNA (guanosine2251-2'-O)-methyltransferase